MDFDKVTLASMQFVADAAGVDDFEKLASEYLSKMEAISLLVPNFDSSNEWINTSKKLSFEGNLKGKLCVLDFFTYCCINCMHILPDLEELEEKFPVESGVAVIGVHSAKFENEKVSANILSAVLRYDIRHAVVNEPSALMWNTMQVQCWPTLVVVSPEGKALLYLVGEGNKDILFKFVDVALTFYKDKVSNNALPIQLARESLKSDQLKYPGKLVVSPDGKKLAISDTGHHQVVIVDIASGVIEQRVGSGKPGWKDGRASQAQFNAPQGLVWKDKDIYVADTENHCVRKIDTSSWDVNTVVGVGKQGTDREGGRDGKLQEISSPWDVLIASTPGFTTENEDCLYIAVAGTHQIWCYYLQDGSWLKKGHQKQGTCLRLVGSGAEENRNNSYPHKAALAQPSGLTRDVVKGEEVIYVADSESSSVRCVHVKTGAVKACVGASRDPTNLFAYGDMDGKGVDAKLQHPLAVQAADDGYIYVADSYNHKVKVVDPLTNTCGTLVGTGNPGSKCDLDFNEPGGLAYANGKLFVADTNNHAVKVVDLQTKVVSQLTLIESDSVDSSAPKDTAPLIKPSTPLTYLEEMQFNVCGGSYGLQVVLGDKLHYTEDVQSKWKVKVFPRDDSQTTEASGAIEEIKCTLPPNKGIIDVKVELLLFVCTEEGVCLMKQFNLHQVLHPQPDAPKHIQATFTFNK